MRTDLSDEQVARRGRVGWGAVSQARDGEDGLSADRRDSLAEDEEDGISRLSFENDAGRILLYGAFGLRGFPILRAKQQTLRRVATPNRTRMGPQTPPPVLQVHSPCDL